MARRREGKLVGEKQLSLGYFRLLGLEFLRQSTLVVQAVEGRFLI